MASEDVKLTPGTGFHLEADGTWKARPIPPDVLKSAKFSGYLTINGYRCTVFDTPQLESWAQKNTGTSIMSSIVQHSTDYTETLSPIAQRVAAKYLRAEQDRVTQFQKKLEADEMAGWDKAAKEYVGQVQKWLPELDEAHKAAVGDLEKTVHGVPKAKHPRVDSYEAQQLQTVFEQYLDEVRAAKQRFDETIMKALQEFIPVGNSAIKEASVRRAAKQKVLIRYEASEQAYDPDWVYSLDIGGANAEAFAEANRQLRAAGAEDIEDSDDYITMLAFQSDEPAIVQAMTKIQNGSAGDAPATYFSEFTRVDPARDIDYLVERDTDFVEKQGQAGPKQVAAELIKIANKINNSDCPQATLVSRDLRKVLSFLVD
jgi:uncharacterized protein YecA (UPF0149 family)